MSPNAEIFIFYAEGIDRNNTQGFPVTGHTF